MQIVYLELESLGNIQSHDGHIITEFSDLLVMGLVEKTNSASISVCLCSEVECRGEYIMSTIMYHYINSGFHQTKKNKFGIYRKWMYRGHRLRAQH